MNRLCGGLVATITVLAMAGCGSSGLVTPTTVSVVSAEELTLGADAYRQFCADCHGEDVRGTDKGPSFLSQVYEPNHHADAAFQLAVQRGSPQHHWNFGDMPPVEGIAPDELEAIVTYVRGVQAELGFID
ncbi:MAG: cytochrome c [Acidimicrobiia bacterium]|nr:cytochrome c [Acidimicrobiia bacterium]NNL27800.1 cytochrome c [Acidimicrobiia bacterium]